MSEHLFSDYLLPINHGSGSYTKISEEDRERLISSFEHRAARRRDWLQVAEVLNIKRETAQSIVAKYRKTGEKESRPRGGFHAIKLNDEMRAALVRYVEKNRPTLWKKCDDYDEIFATSQKIEQKIEFNL